MKLLCVPGWLGEATDFDAVLEALASLAPGWEAVRYELPGLGGRVAEGALGIEDAARDLLEHAPQGAAVLAYSMGARVALRAACLDSSAFAGLVLCGVHPGLTRGDARSARLALDRERSEALRADPKSFLDAWFEMPLFESLRAAPSFESLQRRRREHFADPRAVEAAAELVVACSLGRQAALSVAQLAKLPPALLLNGARDTKFCAIAEALLTEDAPETWRGATIPNAGHALLTEAPDAIAEHVQRFAREALRCAG